MLREFYFRLQNILMFCAALPFIYGCQGGGGGSSSGGSFGFASGGGAVTASLTQGGTAGTSFAPHIGALVLGGGNTITSFAPHVTTTVVDGGQAVAQITNPEPATMFLVGGGMIAMSYLRNRRKKN